MTGDPSVDDALEAARAGKRITAPAEPPPAIGGQHTVREPMHPRPGVRTAFRAGGKIVVPGGAPLTEGHGLVPLTDEEWESLGAEYFERLDAYLHSRRLDKWLEWGPHEWRTIPGFANYELNGYTREVRRPARVDTLANGRTRRMPAKDIPARNSSVTLSHEGVASSHGIEKLWRLTFPEYVADPNSWDVHSLRTECIPGELGRVMQTHR